VKEEGLSNTTVNLTGSSQVALARAPQRRNAEVATRAAPEPQVQMYDGTVRPLPPPQQITPPTVDSGGSYYDEYGRPLQRGQVYRRTYQADSYYADRQPYAPQQQYPQPNPYQPRYYGQQQPQYGSQQPGQYYAEPQSYYRREYYGN
jgi:hypothetical protein